MYRKSGVEWTRLLIHARDDVHQSGFVGDPSETRHPLCMLESFGHVMSRQAILTDLRVEFRKPTMSNKFAEGNVHLRQ